MGMASSPTPPLRSVQRLTRRQVDIGIQFLDDIQGFYRERAELGSYAWAGLRLTTACAERDYGTKLHQLVEKYQDKKSKKQTVVSVGEDPKMTPGSLEKWGNGQGRSANP